MAGYTFRSDHGNEKKREGKKNCEEMKMKMKMSGCGWSLLSLLVAVCFMGSEVSGFLFLSRRGSVHSRKLSASRVAFILSANQQVK
jgi:hypothetical protein